MLDRHPIAVGDGFTADPWRHRLVVAGDLDRGPLGVGRVDRHVAVRDLQRHGDLSWGVVRLLHLIPPQLRAYPEIRLPAGRRRSSVIRPTAVWADWTSKRVDRHADRLGRLLERRLERVGHPKRDAGGGPVVIRRRGGDRGIGSADIDQAGVLARHPNLGVAVRELLGQLEGGVAEDVEEPEVERRLERPGHALQRGRERVVRAERRLQVAADGLEVRGEIHRTVLPSGSRTMCRHQPSVILTPC